MGIRQSKSNVGSVRLARLREVISEASLEGIILVPGPNLSYFTGVNSLLLERTFLLFVPKEGELQLVAPTLESGPFLKALIPVSVHAWNDGEGPTRAIEETAQQLNLQGKWGIEGSAPYDYVHTLYKSARPQLENAEPILQNLRARKDELEIRFLQRSATALCKSFLQIPNLLKPGKSELQLAQEISLQIQKNGADAAGDVLVQSGPNAADGHHQANRRKIKRSESVVVDATCTYSGYFADITRTFIIGKDNDFERLYESVYEAQANAIKASKSGVTVGSIDRAARSVFEREGLAKYFVHRTGHGLGLEVHEAPYIVAGGDEIIQPSMVFTVEPGVYMQAKGGIRIEDEILARREGSKVLTASLAKDFGWWR